MAGLDIPFEVRVIDGIDESYPIDLPAEEIALFIAQKKAQAYRAVMACDELIITADTVVVIGDEVLGKPRSEEEAAVMLRKLSGRTHQVVTGVCITTAERQSSFSVTTRVTFKELSAEEITYYVSHYHPLDKAGAYGVQEWIGYVGVTSLEGSYYNVMGLPVQRIYSELMTF